MPDTITTEFLALRDRYIASCFTKLNPVQQQAVFTTEGPLLILAGAGSGKTTVLVNRIANIIRFGRAYGSKEVSRPVAQSDLEQLRTAIMCGQPVPQSLMPLMSVAPARPWNVLAIPFTNKAAGELKERLKAMLGDTMGGDVFASTFHSACVRILRRDAERIGFPKSFTIYDSDDQQRVIKQIYKELMIDDKFLPVKSAISQISGYKDKLLSAKDVAAEAPRDTKAALISKIYTAYSNRLRTAGAMDFDDLIFHTVQMLKTDAEAREYYQQKFRYVVVDEYQDTSVAQFHLVRLLAGGSNNVCVVGDDDQSIYKFRGATIENILNFEKVFAGAKTIRLEQNYRSTSNILNAANSVIKNNNGRKGKTLWTQNGDGDKVHHYTAASEQDEASHVAEVIGQNLKNGASLKDHAVLYRMNAQSNPIETYFARAGIPYRIVGGQRFFDRKEIKDMTAYFALINNPADTVRLQRIINVPKRGIGATMVSHITEIATGLGISAFEVCQRADEFQKTARSAQKLRDFAAQITYFQQCLEDGMLLSDLLQEILEKTKYTDYLQEDDPEKYEDRLNNIKELSSMFIKYQEENEDFELSDFLEDVALVSDIDSYNDDEDSVVLMTLHSAKGLEFPVVFVADTDHKFNQSDAIRPVLTHSRLGVGVMLRAPRAAKRFKTLPYAALAQAIRTETLSEEMRVLYVALTRAQDALIITVPLKKTASALKTPALCAAAEATGSESMRSMGSWAGWILTAAMLHPDSDALWGYTSFLPHHRPTEVPLTIRLVELPENAEQPPAPRAPQPDPATVEMLKASFAWHSPRAALEKVPAKVSVSAVAHAARPVALERPAFLQKTGMTGAERGTAIHAFMQSVPFDGPAPDLDAEVKRQTDLQLLDAALADKLDLDAVRPFFESAVWRRIRHAKQILREEPFITALPAAEVTPAAQQGSAAEAEVLVQGIADLVLVFDEHAEILDYKTDRSRDAQYYIDEYAAQLRLYRRAFAQRLSVPVTKLTIYSFAIDDEIDVPLA